MRGRSFWRGGAQRYAFLVGPTVGDYFSVRQLCRCRAGSGTACGRRQSSWHATPPAALLFSDLPYSAADSRDLRQTKWVSGNSGTRKPADVRFGSIRATRAVSSCKSYLHELEIQERWPTRLSPWQP